MAKPASLPSWATDTNLSSGTESGSSTKLDPGSGVKAQGWVPGEGFVGRWANWWANLVYQWTQYLDNLPNESAFTSSAFTWTGAHIWNGSYSGVGPCLRDTSTAELRYTDAAGASSSRSRTIRLSGMSGQGVNLAATPPAVTGSGYATIAEDRGGGAGKQLIWDLSGIVPTGATITLVRALIKPGEARAAQTSTPGDNGRVWCRLFTHAPDFTTPAAGSVAFTESAEDDGTTNVQVISTGTVSVGVTKSTTVVQVHVWGGSTATTHPDRVYAVEVTFDDPGPRNY